MNAVDALAMIPLGLAVGTLGLRAILVWWLAIGVFGLPFIWCWNRFAAGGANGGNGGGMGRRFDRRGGMPFIPVIVAAAIIAVVVGTML